MFIVFKRFGLECRGDFGSIGPFWPLLLVILDVQGSKYVKMDPRGLVARDVTLQSCSKCLKTMFKQVFKRFRVGSKPTFGSVDHFLTIFTATSKIFSEKTWKIEARGHTMRDETLESSSKWLKIKVNGGFVPKIFSMDQLFGDMTQNFQKFSIIHHANMGDSLIRL